MPEIPRIRLVAGLGNPGVEYTVTRHNVGFMAVDQVAANFGSTWERSTKWEAVIAKCGDALLVKPMSFMNRSGDPLFAVAQFYKISPQQILVVMDDLALPLGHIRIRPDGGTGGHNGLESVILRFGTEEIPRLRIGIGAAPRDAAVDYVLSGFFEEEKPLVRLIIERAAKAVKCTIDNGMVSAMNTFNKSEES
jgi:PTH1 family peptidyl-tRNA hydrolase